MSMRLIVFLKECVKTHTVCSQSSMINIFQHLCMSEYLQHGDDLPQLGVPFNCY